MDFDVLQVERKALNNAVAQHSASVLHFRPAGLPWFRLNADEAVPESDHGGVRHLSTTASCLESLADVPPHQAGFSVASTAIEELAETFAEGALARPHGRWESEGAARVYSRVRTLPAILALSSDDLLKAHGDVIHDHVVFVWDRLVLGDPHAQGIAEAAQERLESRQSEEQGSSPATAPVAVDARSHQTYPPNAFHTYWALRLLRRYESRTVLPALPTEIALKRSVALLWSNRTLATQTALIGSGAERVDAHQLAWALLADLEGHADQPVTAASERRQLYEAALAAFFGEQRHSGRWPLYEALFHYPQAGNAYAYTFETLAELLRPALRRSAGRLLRDLLRPHLKELLRARSFASRTAVDLAPGAIGWSSGHHPQRVQPEGWATAAVFSFLQALRRLTGCWTAEVAEEKLGVGPSPYPDRTAATNTLRERGDTWTEEDEWSVGRQLAGLFMHPVQATPQAREDVEPDRPLVGRDDARSAILFGPPGTGKTTLVQALAGAIDWNYVEVNASEFLSSGMDQVPAQADAIFARLMELDRCVVLFDEVDELVRDRRGDTSDPFGRFLTTSMLPKLAMLWEQRRVLFFVATNNIDKADPAIRRSQRFDAAIFTAPASFAVKAARLRELLEVDLPDDLSMGRIATALHGKMDAGALGVFALLRWDQVAELAELVRAQSAGVSPSTAVLEDALKNMGRDLRQLEFADEEKDPFEIWREFQSFARRDYGRPVLGRIDSLPNPLPNSWRVKEPPTTAEGYVHVGGEVRSAIKVEADGAWRLEANGWTARDDGLLNFTAQDGHPSSSESV